MSDFSKGKWRYVETNNTVVINDGKYIPVAFLVGCSMFSKQEYQANGRLIAAAPEMYKLLEEANQIFYLWRRTNNDEDERRSVIDEINERYKDFEIHSMNLLAYIDGEE